MHIDFDLWIVAAYLLIVLGVGCWAGRGMRTMADFSVAGRSFGTFVIFATLSASFIGGGFSLGNAEKVFSGGLIYVAALWGFSLKEILVAGFIAPRTICFRDAISVGDIIASRYGKVAQVFSGFMSTFLCAGILGAQVGGIGTIFATFTNIDKVWGIMIGLGIVIAYSSFGGMRAVVFTDVIQFSILAVMIPATLVFGIKAAGGWQDFTAALPAGRLSFTSPDFPPLAFLSLFLTFVLGETLVPPYVQRLFIGRNASHTTHGTLLAGLFSFPFFLIAGAIGLVALALNPNIDANQAMPFVIREVLPVGLRGVVIAAVISIVMSSADSFLNAASVAITHDIIQPCRRVKLSNRMEVVWAQAATLLVGVLAAVFALSIASVFDILTYAYNFWAPIILVPLAAVLLGAKPRPLAFYVAAGSGLTATLVWNLVLKARTGIDGLIIGVIANLIGFIIVCYWPRQDVRGHDQEHREPTAVAVPAEV